MEESSMERQRLDLERVPFGVQSAIGAVISAF